MFILILVHHKNTCLYFVGIYVHCGHFVAKNAKSARLERVQLKTKELNFSWYLRQPRKRLRLCVLHNRTASAFIVATIALASVPLDFRQEIARMKRLVNRVTRFFSE